MKEKLYNFATLWLTLSVIFFIIEYVTDWLEVVTLGGLVAGSFIEGFIVNLGLGLMWKVVGKEMRTASIATFFQPTSELAKALIIVAAFTWEGALILSHVMPGYTLHTYLPHVVFLLMIYPALAISLDIIARQHTEDQL